MAGESALQSNLTKNFVPPLKRLCGVQTLSKIMLGKKPYVSAIAAYVRWGRFYLTIILYSHLIIH
jgi:hypothetical protein